MNPSRRLQIKNIISEIDEVKSVLAEIKETILNIKSDEEEYRDSMPENLQNSDRYYKADEACDNIENAINNIDDIGDELDVVLDSLRDAIV